MNDKMQFPFWNTNWMNNQPDWFQNQNQYMDAWSSFQQFMPNSSTGIPPMADAMSSWWKSASPSLSDQNYDFYNKMMQQGQAFYFVSEQFSKLLEGMKDVDNQSEQWQTAFNDQFASIKSMLEKTSADLQGSFSNTPSMMGKFGAEQFQMATMTSSIEKMLSTPGVGPDRDTQARMQEGLKLFNNYQQVSIEYQEQLSKAGIKALEAMRLKILEMSKQGHEIKSLREIYDLWIDCNEKAYAELVHTDEYSELYGRLTNSLLAVKQHQGTGMEKLLEKLNIPTRQGMNTVLQRVQKMKRDQLKSVTKITALEKETQELRAMIESRKEPSVTKITALEKETQELRAMIESGKEPSATAKNADVKKRISKKTTKKVSKKSSVKKTIV